MAVPGFGFSFSAQGFNNPLSRFVHNPMEGEFPLGTPPIEEEEQGWWGRTFGPIGGWFGTSIGPGAFASAQERNKQMFESMSGEQQSAVSRSVMYSVIGANAPSAIGATVRPMLGAQREARELGVTPSQYEAGLMHDIVLSETAMTRNIIYSSVVAAPFVMGASPLVASAFGGGVVGTGAGLLATGALGAASSLPFTVAETGSPYGPGGGRLTIGETALLGVDVGGDLLLGGIGKGIKFSGLSTYMNDIVTRGRDRLVTRTLSDLKARFGKTPTDFTKEKQLDAWREDPTLDLSEANFAPSDRFKEVRLGNNDADPKTTVSYHQYTTRLLKDTGNFIPDLQNAKKEELSEHLSNLLYWNKKGVVAPAEHKFVQERARRLIEDALPRQTDLSVRDSIAQAQKIIVDNANRDAQHLSNLRSKGLDRSANKLEDIMQRIQLRTADAIQYERSSLYERASSRWIQDMEGQLSGARPTYQSQIEEMLVPVMQDSGQIAAFRRGLIDPRSGIKSVTTREGILTSSGLNTELGDTPFGGPESLLFNEEFSDTNKFFQGILNFTGNERDFPRLEKWLKESGLKIAGGGGKGPGKGLALYITNDPSRDSFYDVWKQIMPADRAEGILKDRKNMFELLGKRFGLFRMADISSISPPAVYTPGVDDITQSTTLNFGGSNVRVSMMREDKISNIVKKDGKDVDIGVDDADAAAVASETWFRSFLEKEYTARRPNMNEASRIEMNTYINEVLRGGDFAFGLTSTLSNAIFKADVQVIPDSQYKIMVEELINKGEIMRPEGARRPDIIGSMASLKRGSDGAGFAFNRQANRIVFKPSYHTRGGSKYIVGNVTQVTPWTESFLGTEELIKQTIKSHSNIVSDNWHALEESIEKTRALTTAGIVSRRMEDANRGKVAATTLAQDYDSAFDDAFSGILDDLVDNDGMNPTERFMKKAFQSGGHFSTSLLRFFGSPKRHLVTKGGSGFAPSTLVEGVYGRFLPSRFFGDPESAEHVKLVFDDADTYRGFTADKTDQSTFEFIRGLEGPDKDDHAINMLLVNYSKGKTNPEYFMPLGRAPIGGLGGLVRRVTVDDAEKFMHATKVNPIDVTHVKLPDLNTGKAVPWNFDMVRAGISRGRPAKDLPIEEFGEDVIRYNDNSNSMLRMLTRANAKKGSIGVLDTYLRLLRDSGVQSDYVGTVFSDSLDRVTQFSGSLEPGVRALQNELKQYLEADPRRTLDRHTIEEYPWLQDHFSQYLVDSGSKTTVVGYEYKRSPQAEARRSSLKMVDLLESLWGLTAMGPSQALTRRFEGGLNDIATDVVRKSGGLHRYFTSFEFDDIVDRGELTGAQQKVVMDGLARARKEGYISGHNPGDYGAALMQASVVEASAVGRRGMGGQVSGEILKHLPSDVYDRYFDDFGATLPSLRVELGGSSSALDPGTTYQIEKVGDDYFVNGHKIADREAGALGSRMGGLRYEGPIGSTIGRKDVAESVIFSMNADEFGGGWEEALSSLAENLLKSPDKDLDLSLLGMGNLTPEGILRTRTAGEVTPTGAFTSVQGGYKQTLAPQELAEHVSNPHRNTLIFDIESNLNEAFRAENPNRDLVDVAYFRAESDRPISWRDKSGKKQSGTEIALPFTDLTPAILKDIMGQVTDIAGYNLWFDMDILARKYGVDWRDKVVWDMQHASDVVGMPSRSRINILADDASRKMKDMSLEESFFSPYGRVPRGTPLKDAPWATTQQLGIESRGELSVNALTLVREFFKRPSDAGLRAVMDVYGGYDVTEVAEIMERMRAMMPEQFGDTALEGVSDWSELGNNRGIAARYMHRPDPNDAPLLPGAGQDVADTFALHDSENVGAEVIAEAMRAGSTGDYDTNMPLLRAWARRSTSSGVFGALSVAPRGMQVAGQGLTTGARKLFGGIGTGLRFGANITGAAPAVSRLGETASAKFLGAAAKYGVFSRMVDENRTDIGEILRGAGTQAIWGNTDIGQFARVMMLPGIYQRSGLDFPTFAASMITTGAPFMTGWLAGSRAAGRQWEAPSNLARFASLKEGELLKSSLGSAMKRGEDYVKVADDIRRQDTRVLRTLRDRGDFNPFLKRMHEEIDLYKDTDRGLQAQAAYDKLRSKLDTIGAVDPLFRREHEGLVEYGNFATLMMRDWGTKIRRSVGRKAKEPYRIFDESKKRDARTVRNLQREADQLMDLALAGGLRSGESTGRTAIGGVEQVYIGSRKMAERELPMPFIPEEWFNVPEVATRFEQRGMTQATAKFDVAKDWDLINDPQMIEKLGMREDSSWFSKNILEATGLRSRSAESFRERAYSVLEQREAMSRDYARAVRFGRQSYVDTRTFDLSRLSPFNDKRPGVFARGAKASDILGNIYGKTIGVENPVRFGKTEAGQGGLINKSDARWRRSRGGPLDKAEWDKAWRPEEYLPWKSVAKSVLAGAIIGPYAFTGIKGHMYAQKLKEEYPEYYEQEGAYRTEDLFNFAAPRGQDRMQSFETGGLSREFPIGPFNALPRVFPGEYMASPIRQYARAHNLAAGRSGETYTPLNEEYQHVGMQGITSPWSYHIYQTSKAAFVSPSRWFEDIPKSITAPGQGQTKPFSALFKDTEWGPLSTEEEQFIGKAGPVDWSKVRGGDLAGVPNRRLRAQLSKLQGEMNETEWDKLIGDAEAYERYYRTAATEDTANLAARWLSPGLRKIGAMQTAVGVREASTKSFDEAMQQDVYGAWELLHSGMRSQLGESFEYDSAEWEQRWAEGTIKPRSALTHEYDYEEHAGQFRTLEDFKSEPLSRFGQLKELSKSWNPFGDRISYVSPRSTGSGYMFVPERPEEEEAEPTSSLIRMIDRNRTELDVTYGRPKIQLQGGGQSNAGPRLGQRTPGGIDVTIAEGGVDEAVIPLDKAVLGSLFGLDEIADANSQELTEIARSIHEFAQVVGTLEGTIGEMTVSIDSSGKGMSDALKFAGEVQKQAKIGEAFAKGDQLAFAPLPDGVSTLETFAGGNVLAGEYWQGRYAEGKADIDRALPPSWDPFKAPPTGDSVWDWASSSEGTGVFNVRSEVLKDFSVPFSGTETMGKMFYPDTKIQEQLNQIKSDNLRLADRIMGGDPSGASARWRYESLEQQKTVTGTTTLAQIGELMPAAQTPVAAYSTETIRPSQQNMFMVDGDTLRVLTEGARILTDSTGVRRNVAESELRGTSDEAFAMRSLFTERVRIAGIDTPESSEPLGIYGNAMLAAFIKQGGENVRMRLTGEAAGGASPWDTSDRVRPMAELWSVDDMGRREDFSDVAVAFGMTRGSPGDWGQMAMQAYAQERGEQLWHPEMIQANLGLNVDINSMSRIEQDRIAAERADTLQDYMLSPVLRDIDTEAVGRGRSIASMPNDLAELYQLIDLPALMEQIVTSGMGQGGAPNFAQLRDQLQPGQFFKGGAALLSAMYDTSEKTDPIREAIRKDTGGARTAALTAVRDAQLFAEQENYDWSDMIGKMPQSMQIALEIEGGSGDVLGVDMKNLQESLSKARVKHYKDLSKGLREEESALKEYLGVTASTLPDYRMSAAIATERVQQYVDKQTTFDDEGYGDIVPVDTKNLQEQYTIEEYSSRQSERLEQERREALDRSAMDLLRSRQFGRFERVYGDELREREDIATAYSQSVIGAYGTTAFDSALGSNLIEGFDNPALTALLDKLGGSFGAGSGEDLVGTFMRVQRQDTRDEDLEMFEGLNISIANMDEFKQGFIDAASAIGKEVGVDPQDISALLGPLFEQIPAYFEASETARMSASEYKDTQTELKLAERELSQLDATRKKFVREQERLEREEVQAATGLIRAGRFGAFEDQYSTSDPRFAEAYVQSAFSAQRPTAQDAGFSATLLQELPADLKEFTDSLSSLFGMGDAEGLLSSLMRVRRNELTDDEKEYFSGLDVGVTDSEEFRRGFLKTVLDATEGTGFDPAQIEAAVERLFGALEGFIAKTPELARGSFDPMYSQEELKAADRDIRSTQSFFDQFSSLGRDQVSRYYDQIGPTMVGGLGVAGALTGVGTAEDMFGLAMQYGQAGRNIRQDDASWAMMGLLGQRDLFTGGFQEGLVTQATSRYQEMNRDVDAAGFANFGNAENMLNDLLSNYGAAIEPFAASIDLSNVQSELDLISALFESLFGTILTKGEEAASDLERMEFGSNPRLQRTSAGGVELRSLIADLPQGFVDSLRQMHESGEEASIVVPGHRTATESESARAITVAGGTVYETGGQTYTYGVGEGGRETITVSENISKRVEQKNVGDKWYTYVDGEWDGNEPVGDQSVPSETLHGSLTTTYDVDSGAMMRQVETYADTGAVTLYEGRAGLSSEEQEELDLQMLLEQFMGMLSGDEGSVTNAFGAALAAGVSREDISLIVSSLASAFADADGQIPVEMVAQALAAAAENVDVSAIISGLVSVFGDADGQVSVDLLYASLAASMEGVDVSAIIDAIASVAVFTGEAPDADLFLASLDLASKIDTLDVSLLLSSLAASLSAAEISPEEITDLLHSIFDQIEGGDGSLDSIIRAVGSVVSGMSLSGEAMAGILNSVLSSYTGGEGQESPAVVIAKAVAASVAAAGLSGSDVLDAVMTVISSVSAGASQESLVSLLAEKFPQISEEDWARIIGDAFGKGDIDVSANVEAKVEIELEKLELEIGELETVISNLEDQIRLLKERIDELELKLVLDEVTINATEVNLPGLDHTALADALGLGLTEPQTSSSPMEGGGWGMTAEALSGLLQLLRNIIEQASSTSASSSSESTPTPGGQSPFVPGQSTTEPFFGGDLVNNPSVRPVGVQSGGGLSTRIQEIMNSSENAFSKIKELEKLLGEDFSGEGEEDLATVLLNIVKGSGGALAKLDAVDSVLGEAITADEDESIGAQIQRIVEGQSSVWGKVLAINSLLGEDISSESGDRTAMESMAKILSNGESAGDQLRDIVELLGMSEDSEDSKGSTTVADGITAILASEASAEEQLLQILALLGFNDSEGSGTISDGVLTILASEATAEEKLQEIIALIAGGNQDGDQGGDDVPSSVASGIVAILASEATVEEKLQAVIALIAGDGSGESGDNSGESGDGNRPSTVSKGISEILESEGSIESMLLAILELTGKTGEESSEDGTVASKIRDILRGEGDIDSKLADILSVIGSVSSNVNIGDNLTGLNNDVSEAREAVRELTRATGAAVAAAEAAASAASSGSSGSSSKSTRPSTPDSSANASASAENQGATGQILHEGNEEGDSGRTVVAGTRGQSDYITQASDGTYYVGASQESAYTTDSGKLYWHGSGNAVSDVAQESFEASGGAGQVRTFYEENIKYTPGDVFESLRGQLEATGLFTAQEIADSVGAFMRGFTRSDITLSDSELRQWADAQINSLVDDKVDLREENIVEALSNPLTQASYEFLVAAGVLSPNATSEEIRALRKEWTGSESTSTSTSTTSTNNNDDDGDDHRVGKDGESLGTTVNDDGSTTVTDSEGNSASGNTAGELIEDGANPDSNMEGNTETLGEQEDNEDLGMWEGGYALPTTGGIKANIAERGEGEAILPISQVPEIFARAFARSSQAIKSMVNTAKGIVGNGFSDMMGSVPAMELAMAGATDSYMDSVNAGVDGTIVIENHITLEMGGEEVTNMVLESEEYARRSGR